MKIMKSKNKHQYDQNTIKIFPIYNTAMTSHKNARLVQHVRSARLHLRLHNARPQMLSLHRLPTFPCSFQAQVEPIEVLAKEIHQALPGLVVVGLVGAKQGPVRVRLDTFHEEIRHPKAIEEIPGSDSRIAMVPACFSRCQGKMSWDLGLSRCWDKY